MRRLMAATVVALTLDLLDNPGDLTPREINDLADSLYGLVPCMGLHVPRGDMLTVVRRLKLLPGNQSRGIYPDYWIGQMRSYALGVVQG